MKSLTFKKFNAAIFFFALLMSFSTITLAQSIRISESNNKYHIVIQDGLNSFELSHNGLFEFTDDDTKIVSISEDGYFELKKKYKGKKRKVRVESENNELIYKFTEGRKKQLDEAEGMRWLASVLPAIVEKTNIGLKSKVAKLYRSGGVDAVKSKMITLEKDYQKSAYLEYLVEEDLSPQEVEKVLELSTALINKDHYCVDFLEDIQPKVLKLENGTDKYLTAIKSLKKSHYQTDLVEDLIENVDLNADHIHQIFAIASDFDSNHYFSEIVQTIAEQKGLSDEQVAIVIHKGVKGVNSGHYKTEVLDEILDNHELGKESMSALFDVLPSINSGHYFAEVVDNIADSQKLNEAETTDLILVLEAISSDHYLAEALIDLSDEVMDHKGTALEAYKKVAKSMNSDHYYREVMQEIE